MLANSLGYYAHNNRDIAPLAISLFFFLYSGCIIKNNDVYLQAIYNFSEDQQNETPMRTPAYLKANDKVGVVAPAGKVEKQQLQGLHAFLQSWHLEPVFGRYLYEQWGNMAGTDEQRAADLQYCFDAPEIKAILCVRGGYGSMRLLSLLNFDRLRLNPKWLVGFSDISCLHNMMHRYGIESMHATMPALYQAKGSHVLSHKSLQQALFGHLEAYELQQVNILRPGVAEGELVGGNLSLLYSCLGTPAEVDMRNKVLFIEEVGEYVYHIDRMLCALQLAGHLKYLKALVVGSMDNLRANDTPFALSVAELISEKVKAYDYPVVMDFPAGHREPNLALILGRRVRLEARAGFCKLVFGTQSDML